MIPMWRNLTEGNIYVGKYLQAKIGINTDDQIMHCGVLKKISENISASMIFSDFISLNVWLFHFISYLFFPFS